MSITPDPGRPAPAAAIAETVRSTTEAATPLPKHPLPLFDRELSWLEFNRRVLGEAENADVPRLERVADLGKKERTAVEEYFRRNLEPILTPLAIDPGHPFPFIANLALNLAIILDSERGETHVVVLRIPETVPRLFAIEPTRFVLLEDVIASHAERFFPGLKLRKATAFRVIRNSDLSIKEDDVQDLLKTMESELRRRERREVVWLELEEGTDDLLTRQLV